MATGDVLCTGGSVAHGDLEEGPGATGGLATNDTFSDNPLFKTRPFPDDKLLGLTDGDAVRDGIGDFDLSLTSFVAADDIGSVI